MRAKRLTSARRCGRRSLGKTWIRLGGVSENTLLLYKTGMASEYLKQHDNVSIRGIRQQSSMTTSGRNMGNVRLLAHEEPRYSRNEAFFRMFRAHLFAIHAPRPALTSIVPNQIPIIWPMTHGVVPPPLPNTFSTKPETNPPMLAFVSSRTEAKPQIDVDCARVKEVPVDLTANFGGETEERTLRGSFGGGMRDTERAGPGVGKVGKWGWSRCDDFSLPLDKLGSEHCIIHCKV